MLASIRFIFFISVVLWPFGDGANKPVEIPGTAKLKKSSLELPAHPEDFRAIRILLMKNIPSVMMKTSSAFHLLDSNGRILMSADSLAGTRVSASSEGIQFGPQMFRDAPLMVEMKGEGDFFLGDKAYRDSVQIIWEGSGKLTLINFVNVENYLKGVLPWEANPKWSREALKAQSVASRTYALFKMIENQNEKFDLSKDVLSQVYAGKNLEHPATDEAIEATRGQILVYRGKIFPAYFHSTCGGATTNAETLWDIESHPSLKGSPCEFCKTSKHYEWRAQFSRSEIEVRLGKSGTIISDLKNIEIAEQDAFGRATKIKVEHGAGTNTVRANDFRLWLDPARLKSTKFTEIKHEGDTFLFRGNGWGHGAGLCQYGMKELAELGYTYQQILAYYYAGSDIVEFGGYRSDVPAQQSWAADSVGSGQRNSSHE